MQITKIKFTTATRLLTLVAATIAIVLMMAGVASAQIPEGSEERITLSPSSTTLKVDAGQTVRGSMKITNNGDVAYGFSVYARPYTVSNEQYDPDFTTQKANTSIYKWVQFDQAAYQVKPGETVEVNYAIRVPSDAAPGGHYGVLFAETDERGLEGTGVARKKRVGNLLYVTVNGVHKTAGEFQEFILPFWQNRAPLVSSARITNTGNVDFRAKVTTTAKDIFGRTKFVYNGDPIVLPETTRLVEMNWEKAPAFGLFSVRQTVEFLDQTHEDSGLVLVAPRWFPVVVALIMLVIGAYALRQKRRNRH